MATCNFYASIYTGISLDSASTAFTGGSLELDNILDVALPKLWASVLIFSIKARQYFDAKCNDRQYLCCPDDRGCILISLLGMRKVVNITTPFAIEFQQLIDDINNSAKVVRECADGATMQRIKSMHTYRLGNH